MTTSEPPAITDCFTTTASSAQVKNRSLSAAKAAKNDEFYTMLPDVERELRHYVNDEDHGGTAAGNQFFGKVVYCNCDDPEWSSFYQYFVMNFEHLGLAGLVTTHYARDTSAYKIAIQSPDEARLALDHFYNGTTPEQLITPLAGDGDFRSVECVDLLRAADIVVTNPPFSLFREYIALLVEHRKQFLIIGNMGAAIYKETFALIKSEQVWYGYSSPKTFRAGSPLEGGPVKSFGNIKWFTNLVVDKRGDEVIPYQTVAEGRGRGLYPAYDNYNAIEVSRVADIPSDHDGVLGVPITFLDRYVPGCGWEIVWQASGNTRASAPREVLDDLGYRQHKDDRGGCGVVRGARVYSRILIRRAAPGNNGVPQ